MSYFSGRAKKGDLDWKGLDEDAHRFFEDKLVALSDDKASFCHRMCRAMGARRVVEVGTSHGVSTLYLADAVRTNGGGTVVATEYEHQKAETARCHFAEGGVEAFIDLREGDLRETLKSLNGPVDFVLMDIWTEMAQPAIELITPHLRAGAAVIADNTQSFAAAYGAYFEYLADYGFSTQTLPFEGGLELSIKT